MALYECTRCGARETITGFVPEACSGCGGTVYDYDEDMKRQAEIPVIASQNDRFRAGFGTDPDLPGKVVVTRSVADLGPVAALAILKAVTTFDSFTEENDPHGLHDFGVFTIPLGEAPLRLYWKIDLYDAAYEYGSPDEANLSVTRRVLTVLQPSEW